MTSRRRLALALSWLALVPLAGWLVGPRLEPSGNLRKFMPAHDASTHRAEPHVARAADASETTTIAIQPAHDMDALAAKPHAARAADATETPMIATVLP